MFRNPTMLFDEVTAALNALLAGWDNRPRGVISEAAGPWLIKDMYPAVQQARVVLKQLKQLKDENAASVSWRPRDE